MKKVVAFALALVTLLTMLVLPVSAAETATQGTGTYGVDWVKYGDLDFDQEVGAKDALDVLKFSVGKEIFSEVQQVIGEVNEDTLINAKDALEILKYTVGKIISFPAGIFYQITTDDGGNEQPEPTPGENTYIQTYNKSNSVNGAYVEDKTADTSYKIDISSMEKNTVYKVLNSAWANKAGVADKVKMSFTTYAQDRACLRPMH